MNKDDLLHFLHSIHNKIRNANGIKLTGLAALNEINNFFALYFIKDNVTKKGLGKECSFDNIYMKYATDEIIKDDKKITSNKIEDRMSYKLWKDVYDSGNSKCILKQIILNEYFSSYFAGDTVKVSAYSTNFKAYETIQEIINMIYKKFKDTEFTYKIYDALGSAYERFKTDEISNSGKHTGQHFTPVSIKKIIIDELKPTHKDKFYEPCSGSGGFIHTACHYVYEHDKKNLDSFKKNIYANEINPELQKPLMINMLLHDIPVKHINLDNECDSLSKDNCKRYMKKMTKCGTNVPFGVKTNLTNWSGYWDPVESGKNIIKDSTAQFIVHIHNCLEKDGIAGVVVDRGILNNGSDGKKSWQMKFRKWLLENNDLYKIVYMPTGTFDYTNFATAIVFFKKGSKTQKVEFYEATFIDPKKKGDIKVSEKPLKTMTFKEIEKQNWSFKMELEKKEELKAGWVKLEDVVEIISGKFNSNDMDDIGDIPFYSCISNNPAGMHSKYSFDNDKYILFIGSGGSQNNVCGSTIGMGKTYLMSGKSAGRSGVFVLIPNNKIIVEYLKYYLDINRYDVNSKAKYSANLGVISMSTLKDLKIPDLSKVHQQEIVDFLDKQFETYDINKLGDKLKDIKLFDLLIAKQYDICADALHLIYRKIETDALVKSLDRDKKAIFNILLNGCDYEIVKLGDVVDVSNSGIRLTEEKRNIGKYPYYGANGIIAYVDEYKYDGEYILTAESGTIGSLHYVEGKFFPTKDLWALSIKNKKQICVKFLLNAMKTINILNKKTGGGIPHLSKSNLIDLDVKIPSLKDQEKIIKEVEKIEKEQTTYRQYGDMLQGLIDNVQNVINKITKNKESKKPLPKKKNDSSSESDSESDSSDSSEDEKPKKKKQTKKKHDSDSDNSLSDGDIDIRTKKVKHKPKSK